MMYSDKIFVFGSNLSGRHGKGAAKLAKSWFGAVNGIGEGITGNTYALPTKDHNLESLPLDTIQNHINIFLEHTTKNPNTQFMITRLGCGLAGYKDEEIAELFYNFFTKNDIEKPANILLPFIWEQKLFGLHKNSIKIIVAGGREFDDYPLLENRIDHIIKNIKNTNSITIVSGGARGADSLGEKYAKEHKLNLEKYPAEWDKFKNEAGPIRNQYMSWCSSHLIAFWDEESRGTKSMISMAKNDGLNTRVITYTQKQKPTPVKYKGL